MTNRALVDQYQQYFSVIRADTRQLREAAYALRYEVYCQEFGYEKQDHFPEHKEHDEFDEHSHHCLLVHKPSETPIGYLRLIVADKDTGNLNLPIELHCRESIDAEKFPLRNLADKTAGEFSRLAVLSTFRRRKSDERKPYNFQNEMSEGEGVHPDRRIAYPVIPLSLSLAGFALIRQSGLDFGLAMMEPRLAYMLRRYGIIFEQIGELMEYHGLRAPYLLKQEETLATFAPDIKDLLDLIGDELAGAHQPGVKTPPPFAFRLRPRPLFR